MTAPDLPYVALVVDKPAAGAATFGKGPGLLRRVFACDVSKIRVLSDKRSTPELFRPSRPCRGPDAGNGVCNVASAAAGLHHKFRGGES